VLRLLTKSTISMRPRWAGRVSKRAGLWSTGNCERTNAYGSFSVVNYAEEAIRPSIVRRFLLNSLLRVRKEQFQHSGNEEHHKR